VSRSPSAFTLGDLLALEELGLELVAGGERALNRPVVGAHPIEVEQPAMWLERDWIMLTTGVRLRHRADEQRLLISELEAAGAAALGFGLELVFKRVPSTLLREAQARSFPIFAVPLVTPFREIVSAVNRALVGRDLRAMQRLSSIQLQLMDALAEEDPQGAVLARLASFVGGTALLFGPEGSVEAATGDAPAKDIWAAIAAHPAVLVEFELDGRHTVATPIANGHAIAGWLAVTRARARAADRLVRPAVRATAPVLSALVHIQGAAREQDRAIRGALLEQALAPSVRQDAGTLAARAAPLGIDLSEPARVVLVRRHANGRVRADLDDVCRQLERRFDESALRHLMSRRSGAVVALVQGDAERVHVLVADVVDEQPGIEAGIGRPLSELSSAPDSLRDAEIAIHRVGQRREARLLDFADFDLPTLLVSEASAERLAPKVEELLGVLRAHAGLHAALVAYLRYEQDIMRAAEAMHLHHNTLRYRLARVEQLIDRSLKSPATIAALYIALAYDEPIVSPSDH
jgi:purine catabolism regulatory family protein/PucR-like helix-turn-helix protein/diguanylate cyclase with GGDEF domain